MFTSLAFLLACTGCQDEITAPRMSVPTGGGRMMGQYVCTTQVASGTTTCRAITSSVGDGARLAIFKNNEGIKVEAGTSSYTAADSTVRIQIRIRHQGDLFSPPIGTPDSVQVTGLKAFIVNRPWASLRNAGDTTPPIGRPNIPASMGDGIAGRVWARNPDGRMNFTRPDQPYWQYNEKLEYSEATQWREWQFTVIPSVSTFDFAVSVYADVPGEPSIPSRPQSGIPDWLYHPDSTATCVDVQPGKCSRRVLRVRFREDAQIAERQIAIQSVSGKVVGGAPEIGYYYVAVGGDGTMTTLRQALITLRSHPKVESASAYDVTPAALDTRFPSDGPGWQSWRVRPLQADGDNWAPEQISAPLAWGCSLGDTATVVAVIDQGFHSPADLIANVDTAISHGYKAYAGQPTVQHGTWTAAVMAGRGGNNTELTGMMWFARLGVFDYTVALPSNATGGTPTQFVQSPSLTEVWPMIVRAGRSGARVINVSVGFKWADSFGPGYNPATERNAQIDSINRAYRHGWYVDLVAALDTLANGNHHPLIVFSAGNEGIAAEWNAARMIVDSSTTYRDQVIVVGASDIGQNLWSSSNHGSIVSVSAPGVSVSSIQPNGTPVLLNGTSIAAPQVAGTAGLLASFDPRLTAADMKRLIVSGARRGGLTAGSIPILNAYEALRGAASRPGAPLCGNPVYQDSTGKVFARRDTVWMRQLDNSPAGWEQLFTFAGTGLDLKHGGKRARFSSGSGFGWALNGTTAGWSSLSTTPDTTANATARSKSGLSHGRPAGVYTDSTATVTTTQTSSTSATRTVRFQLFINGTAHRFVDVTLPRRQFLPVQYNGCASWFVSDPSITNCQEPIPFGGTAWRDSVVTRAIAAYSPAGDTLVLAVAQDSLAFDISAPLPNGNTMERPYGAYEATQWTDLYFVPVSGGGAVRGPVRVGRRIDALGLSEDGRYLVAQIRNRFFSRQSTLSCPLRS